MNQKGKVDIGQLIQVIWKSLKTVRLQEVLQH
jgi:hypothetical protein